MPKAFTDKEKDVIREKLLQGARECITRYGIKKSSVDDLVKIAGISKGGFYLFYPSKEHLFYDVIMDCSEGLHSQFERSVQDIEGEVTVEKLVDHIIEWIKEVEKTFLISIFENGELEYLQRKLPEDVVVKHHIGDDELLIRLFNLLGMPVPPNIPVFAGALRSVFLTMLYKRTIGDDIYYDVLRELFTALFERLFTNK